MWHVRRLHIQFYVAILATLAVFLVVTVLFWSLAGTGTSRGEAWSMDTAAQLADTLLPPSTASVIEQQQVLDNLHRHLRMDLALYDAREVSPLPRLSVPPTPSPRESERAMRSRSAVLVSAALVVVLGGALFAVALVIQPRDRGEGVASSSRPESRPESKSEPRPEPSPIASAPVAVAPTTPSVTPAAPPATPSAPPTVAGPPLPPTAPPTPKPSPAPVMVTPKVAVAPVGSVQVVPSPENPGPAPAVQAVAPPNLEGLVGVSSPYRLVARTTEATWIRVRTEDGRSTEESIPAGEIREYVSNRPFILTVGNAAGVSFELNGRMLPPLGARGAVIPRLVLPPENR